MILTGLRVVSGAPFMATNIIPDLAKKRSLEKELQQYEETTSKRARVIKFQHSKAYKEDKANRDVDPFHTGPGPQTRCSSRSIARNENCVLMLGLR